jgi:quercetin dioxygenase-like cupin family protein
MPPHTHPYSEVVTVISGTIGTGHGETFEKKGEMLKPGSLWVCPARHAHYAWTGNEEEFCKSSSSVQGASITSIRLTTPQAVAVWAISDMHTLQQTRLLNGLP